MKTIHKILIVSAFIGITAAVVVSCNKENTTRETIAPTVSTEMPAPKVFPYTQFATVLTNYWKALDSTYQANPTAFLRICNNNDYDSLNIISHITLQQNMTLDSMLNIFYSDLGNSSVPISTPCSSCQADALSNLASVIVSIRFYMNELKTVNIGAEIYDAITATDSDLDLCIRQCLSDNYNNNLSLHACEITCILTTVSVSLNDQYMAIHP